MIFNINVCYCCISRLDCFPLFFRWVPLGLKKTLGETLSPEHCHQNILTVRGKGTNFRTRFMFATLKVNWAGQGWMPMRW